MHIQNMILPMVKTWGAFFVIFRYNVSRAAWHILLTNLREVAHVIYFSFYDYFSYV